MVGEYGSSWVRGFVEAFTELPSRLPEVYCVGLRDSRGKMRKHAFGHPGEPMACTTVGASAEPSTVTT